jgi:hypothetical protein
VDARHDTLKLYVSKLNFKEEASELVGTKREKSADVWILTYQAKKSSLTSFWSLLLQLHETSKNYSLETKETVRNIKKMGFSVDRMKRLASVLSY